MYHPAPLTPLHRRTMVHMHHRTTMRLSITLDPDLHQMAAARARARHTSISREINDLIRQAITPAESAQASPTQPLRDPLTGFLVSPGRPGLTLDDFQRMKDDEDLRHMESNATP